jgi:hypothetical protein
MFVFQFLNVNIISQPVYCIIIYIVFVTILFRERVATQVMNASFLNVH